MTFRIYGVTNGDPFPFPLRIVDAHPVAECGPAVYLGCDVQSLVEAPSADAVFALLQAHFSVHSYHHPTEMPSTVAVDLKRYGEM